jgi:hypothetical protein
VGGDVYWGDFVVELDISALSGVQILYLQGQSDDAGVQCYVAKVATYAEYVRR